jgi:hypothetical protein
MQTEPVSGTTGGRSGPECPADGDGAFGAEIIAQHTHAAQFAFFRIYTITFHFDKDTHGAQVNTFVMAMTMTGLLT